MFTIIFAAMCVAVASAESSSVSSYSSSPSNMRDYEYAGSSYLSGKTNYADVGGTSYITTGGSPYAKSDSRYSSDTSSDSNDPRASLTSSFYKSKYGSDAVVNALRPTGFHTSPSSSSSSSSTSDLSSGHYGSGDYTAPASSSSSSASSAYYGGSTGSSHTLPSSSGSSGSLTSSDYTSSGIYGDRGQTEHQLHRGAYATSAAEALASGQSEYTSRPSTSTYPGYTGGSSMSEYSQSRPSNYGHSGPMISSLSTGDYNLGGSSHHHHHPHHHQSGSSVYSSSDDYPSHGSHSQAPHSYKTYVMSNPGPSSYPSKYQSVFGAIKSLFGGGPMASEGASSSSHVPAYLSGPSSGFYSPSMMHGSGHHSSSPVAMSSGGPGYYFTSGSGPSSSSYSKSYPPMRLMSNYGGGSSSAGNKVIVIRDNGSGHSSGYPSSAGSILGSASSYPTKSKLAAFASSGGGPTYISASPSSLSYSSGPSSGYSSSYSSSGNFGGGHGGSTFLGYSS